MTLRERLQARIDSEQAEILRIKADAIENGKAAQQRIAVLQQAATVLDANPQIEGLLAGLHKMGIEL